MLRRILPALALLVLPLAHAQAPPPAVQEALLIPATETEDVRMGYALDYDGGHLVVGAPLSFNISQCEGCQEMDDSGEVFVFERDGSGWVQTADLIPPVQYRFAMFGSSVAVDGDRVAVGAPGAGSGVRLEAGAAYIYEYDGTDWELTEMFEGEEELDRFGTSVDLDGDRLYVGATGAGNDAGSMSARGSVYVYFFDGVGWFLESQLFPEVEVEFSSPDLGSSVSASGDWLFSGAPDYAIDNGSAGAAYAFHRTAAGWTQEAFLRSDLEGSEAGFGASVSLDGDIALVGEARREGGTSTGAVYVYERSGMAWSQTTRLSAASGQGGLFGQSLSLTDSVAVVGAPSAGGTGRAYVFQLTDSGWVQRDLLFAENQENGGRFGESVGYANGRAVVGEPLRRESSAIIPGAAYVFGSVLVDDENAPRTGTAALSAPTPNPSRETARLTLTLDAPEAVRAILVDALGREVAVLHDGVAVGETELRVDTATLPAGIYVVRVTGETVSAARRLTVVR